MIYVIFLLFNEVCYFSWDGLGNLASSEAMRLFVKILEVRINKFESIKPFLASILNMTVTLFNRKKILHGIQRLLISMKNHL